MRQLNSNSIDQSLQIIAVDQPMPGHPHTRYDILGFNTAYNAAANDPSGPPAYFSRLPVIFQSGPVHPDMPQNGVTEEALLAVVADHLQSKQQTLEACPEYQQAQIYIRQAISLLTGRPAANQPVRNIDRARPSVFGQQQYSF